MKTTITCFCIFVLPLVAFAQTVGLIQHSSGSLDDGYVLFAPIRSDTTYLIDKCGREIHKWASGKTPGLSVYLLPDGSILRTEAIPNSIFNSGGAAGGKIEKIDWNSNVVWSYTLSDTTETQNHDVCPLPNGNILVSVWQNISVADAISAGRDPSILGVRLWAAKIIELQPVGTNAANIVWEWDMWDHLVQEFDNTKSNYGVVADHPELLNLNFNGTIPDTSADWIHLNAVTYNPTLDQVMFSSHSLSEIYIIDHSTTTAQAASHTGGTHGKGGDFLYRWGNPQAYNRGTTADRQLYLQHNPNWIPAGYTDSGKIIIFNNGVGRPGGNATSVDIIAQPVDGSGDYTITTGQPYGPSAADWSYMNPTSTDFFTQSMGSAQRLSNGNTLVDDATIGDFFELDPSKQKVWEYINPVSSTGPIAQGTTSTSTQVFRSVFYPAAYPAFTGELLTPGNPIELNPLPSTCDTTTGVKEINAGSDVSLFPNPTTSYFNIAIANNSEIKLIEVRDLTGQLVCASEHPSIDLSGKPNGLYFVKVTMANGYFYIEKVVKK